MPVRRNYRDIMNNFLNHRAVRQSIAPKWRLVLVTLLSLQVARAELLFYEGFDYPADEKLGESSSVTNWENSKTTVSIVSGSLDYEGLKAPIGHRLYVQSSGASLDGVRTAPAAWAEQFGGTLYVSFVLRLRSVAGISSTGEGTSLLTIGHTSNSSQLLGINLLNDGTIRLGILKYPSDGTVVSSTAFFTNGPGANLSTDDTIAYFIVAKYEWLEGPANDRVTLWVNPTTLGTGEDANHKLSVSSGPDGAKSAGRLTISRGPDVYLDELRLGQTWAEVTPPDEPRQHFLIVAVLAGSLIAAGLWITQLRRKVKERSAALGAQIQERQKAEQQRLMEQERARIAHDLHDELGADITEIGMLATRVQNGAGDSDDGRRCLEQLADKTRQMVTKLEEIVWAMNPQHDSLGALVSYFSFFADRFLGLANIKLTVDTSEDATSVAVEARARHQLFLVFREALANVVKHSGATEVRLVVRVENRALHVSVTDNGRGLRTPESSAGGHEGIASMRRRMEKLGGQFEVAGEAGRGTTVKFSVPLHP
jgi:signal transduction histidine kinase